MPLFLITEHHGWKIRERLLINAADQEEALRFSAGTPFRMPPDARTWPYIDDGLGGGALIDPGDENHCLRADPREDPHADALEDSYGSDLDGQ